MAIRVQAGRVMRRLTAALMAAMLVVSAFAAVPAVTMAQETATPDGEPTTATPEAEPETATATPDAEDANETDDNGTDPGAQLAGVIGVGEAELDGELRSRTFGIRVARAASDGAAAGVVADQLNDSEERLGELRERKEALQEARENGSMSESKYRAEVARLHTETRNVERLTNETNETASGLPAETLAERGINATRIGVLSERAGELSGPEVAEIARGIAGEGTDERTRPEQARDGGDRDGEDRPDGADAGDGDASDRGGQNDGADAKDGNDGDASDRGGQDDGTDAPDGDDDAPADGENGSSAGGDGSGSNGDDTSDPDESGDSDASGSGGSDRDAGGR